VLKGLVQDAGLRLPIATLIADEAVFLSSESMLSEDVTLVARLLQEKVPALASLIRIEPFRLKQVRILINDSVVSRLLEPTSCHHPDTPFEGFLC
jgi:hypothetical protein